MNLELADVEVFLALAEELHFGRTAERLHVSPARVSQRVRALEREIGGALFERTSRRVVLTPLGGRLHTELRAAYDQLTAAVCGARAAARDPVGQLRIGHTSTTAGVELDGLVRAIDRAHPEIEVVLCEVPIEAPLNGLRGGAVDLLVNWLVFDAPDLTEGPVLGEYGMVLMVAADNPLAGRSSVSFEEAAEYEVNELPAFREQNGDRFFYPLRTPSGRPVRRIPVTSWYEAISNVARGRSVQVTAALMADRLVRPDLVFVPIDDLPPVRLGLLWCTANENARIRAAAALVAG